MSRRFASRRYAGGLGPSRIRTRIPTTRQLGQWVSLRKTPRFRVRLKLSQSRCLSLLLAMSGRVFLFLPPRGHEPPPTLRERLNPNLSLYRHRFPIPRYAKRPDVALFVTEIPFHTKFYAVRNRNPEIFAARIASHLSTRANIPIALGSIKSRQRPDAIGWLDRARIIIATSGPHPVS